MIFKRIKVNSGIFEVESKIWKSDFEELNLSD